MANTIDQSGDQGGEWNIRIETRQDAIRYARLGGYAGFTYACIITFVALLVLFLGREQMASQPQQQIFGMYGMIVIRFMIYWLLSWRTHTGRGIIAAPLLLLFFCLEIGMVTFMIFKSGMFFAVIIPILFAIIGYVMYAGVKGNWANWRYRNNRP